MAFTIARQQLQTPRLTPVAGTIVRDGNLATRCFPENYLVANPQLNGANFTGNLGRNNYHSMQVQLSMRPRQGISFQASYTWAKSMGIPTDFLRSLRTTIR